MNDSRLFLFLVEGQNIMNEKIYQTVLGLDTDLYLD